MLFQEQLLHLTQLESEPPHSLVKKSNDIARKKLHQLPVVICFHGMEIICVAPDAEPHSPATRKRCSN